MKRLNKILIPFTVDDPIVGRVIYPLDKLLWIVFIILLVPSLYPQLVDYFHGKAELNIIASMLPIFIVFGSIIFLINRAIKKFLYDRIIIEKEKFKFCGSRVFSKPKIVFPLSQISKLIWLETTVREDYQIVKLTNDLILQEKNETRHFLLKDFNIGVSEKNWSKFLNKVENQTGLTIEKIEEILNIKKNKKKS
jgi:hypothetical protein